MRQGAAQRWVELRDYILQGQRPHSAVQPQLQACDHQLRVVSRTVETQVVTQNVAIPIGNLRLTLDGGGYEKELASITDDFVYAELAASDQILGRWTVEDPSLRGVLRWLRARLR